MLRRKFEISRRSTENYLKEPSSASISFEQQVLNLSNSTMTIDSCPAGGAKTSDHDPKAVDTELVVFDFDETVVDCNSDTFINQLAHDGTIPKEIWNRFLDERDWTAYMQQVFNYLHQNNVSESDYDRCLEKMSFVDGMGELLEFIRSHQNSNIKRFDAIIISDANTYFIGHFLKSRKMENIFR